MACFERVDYQIKSCTSHYKNKQIGSMYRSSNSTPMYGNTAHVVFDFDCTLSSRHLYHTMHSGDIYLEHLQTQQSAAWDTRSTRVLDQISKSEHQYDQGDDGAYGHMPGLLMDAHDFTAYIFGGQNRINQLRECIKTLSTMGAVLHISTKGIVSDVIDVLRNIHLLQYFQFIDGLDDTYESKLLYHVGKGFMQNSKTFYGRAVDLTSLPNVFHFASKPDFIRYLVSEDKANFIVYLDDDSEYYDAMRQDENVLTVDIGKKESIYQTEQENLGYTEMRSLIGIVSRATQQRHMT